MAVDKNKIAAEATKHVQKGAFDKAIQAYQRVLAEDPKDVRVLLKVAELQQKKNDSRAAVEAYDKVAQTYAEQGFFLKSVAVYKQIVKLAPEDVRVNERLAALYQQLGLMSDAMAQFQAMATAYEKAGDGPKLTDVLKRMVELDPENIASSIKLGELYARAHQAGPALECFRRAADYLKKHNRADEWVKVADRIAALSPDDLGLTRELANIYLAKGDTKRALAKLQLCFKADPKDVDTLQLLAQAFRDLGQTSKTLSVYKELARVHEERGRAQEAQATWRKVHELAPADEDARAALGPASAPAAPARPAAVAPPRPGSAPGAARPSAVAPPPPAVIRAPPPGPPPGAGRAPPARPAPSIAIAPPPAPPPSAAGPDAIPKLLTEADVYVKYGLVPKALDHLRKVLAIDPDHGPAHEKARELHLTAGDAQEAAQAGARAVRAFIARGDLDRAREAVSRLAQIAPGSPDLRALSAAVGGTEEVALVGEEDEVVLAAGDVAEEPEADDDALALAAATGGDDEVVEDEEPAPGPPPAAPPPARAAPAARPPPAARPAPAPRSAAARAAPPPEPDEEVDLSDEIEEADFFVQQGLLDDAREALGNLLAFYPGHSALEAKLAEVERKGRAAPAQELVAADVDDASFDIARELAEMGGEAAAPAEEDFQYSVEDVFNQFKKGVEQTVKAEDSATHYDLGIAYREMGLVEDAIHEFETALAGNDRGREVDCLSMIGLCQLSKGDGVAAVAAFRRALASDRLTRDAAKAIHFDLAAAYEGRGDAEAALYYFQRVAKADPAFRDVAERVAALGDGPGRAPPEERARPPSAPAGRAPPPPVPPPVSSKKNIGYL